MIFAAIIVGSVLVAWAAGRLGRWHKRRDEDEFMRVAMDAHREALADLARLDREVDAVLDERRARRCEAMDGTGAPWREP